jgi:hypothetical protein
MIKCYKVNNFTDTIVCHRNPASAQQFLKYGLAPEIRIEILCYFFKKEFNTSFVLKLTIIYFVFFLLFTVSDPACASYFPSQAVCCQL